jgi:anti-sigma factor RsiW
VVHNLPTEQLITDYLLGEVSEQQRTEIEERFFANDDFFERVQAAEDDLIDEYVNGELTERERLLFEKNFAITPQRKQRIEFSRSLMQRGGALVRESPRETHKSLKRLLAVFLGWQKRTPGISLTGGLVTALLAVSVLAGVWLFIENRRLRANFEQAQAEQRSAQRRAEEQVAQQSSEQLEDNAHLKEELENERRERVLNEQRVKELEQQKNELVEADRKPARRTTSEPLILAVFTPLPGSLRGSGKENTLNIPRKPGIVPFELYTEATDYQSYVATLRDESQEILRQTGLRGRPTRGGKVIAVRVPSTVLTRSDYSMTLSGIDRDGHTVDLEDYQFKVNRK